MDKKAFTIVKWNANRWCVSYEGDAINGKKAFSVNDIGVINQVGDFGTLKEARNWVDLDCPVSEIEKSITSLIMFGP
jgi:high-affinity K+ transport system ATPase subunit B